MVSYYSEQKERRVMHIFSFTKAARIDRQQQ